MSEEPAAPVLTERLLNIPHAVASRWTRRVPWHYEDVLSACHEAFALAVRRFSPARSPNGADGLGGYVYGFCRNAAGGELRRLGARPYSCGKLKRVPRHVQINDALAASLAYGDRGQDAVDGAEAVAYAKSFLPPLRWRAVELLVLGGATGREAGEELGCTKQHASWLAREAIGELRRRLTRPAGDARLLACVLAGGEGEG